VLHLRHSDFPLDQGKRHAIRHTPRLHAAQIACSPYCLWFNLSWRSRNNKKRMPKSLHMENSCALVEFNCTTGFESSCRMMIGVLIKSYYSLPVLMKQVNAKALFPCLQNMKNGKFSSLHLMSLQARYIYDIVFWKALVYCSCNSESGTRYFETLLLQKCSHSMILAVCTPRNKRFHLTSSIVCKVIKVFIEYYFVI
jgi:hypothetical protein